MTGENYNRGGYIPPNSKIRWHKGKKCSICGQEIKEEHLSKNDFEKNYELKWGVHWACTNKAINKSDRETK